MSRELLQQALDALESLQDGCTDSDDGTVEAITVWCPELIDALRAALAAPQPEPVALCDALRWSGAKESHGAMMFSPEQLRKFYEFASAPPAAPAPAVPDDATILAEHLTRALKANGDLSASLSKARSMVLELDSVLRMAESHNDGKTTAASIRAACEPYLPLSAAPAVREPQDERIRWRDAVIKEAESALRTAEQELSEMPAWANIGHAAKRVTHALAVIAALGDKTPTTPLPSPSPRS
jgi:hypothetical protein